MFIEERHREILRILEEKGSITTAEIQRKFSIGYDSAKRDLRILEEKGMLKRTHGGAIPLHQVALGRPKGLTVRDIDSVRPNYLEIARYAISLISNGDVIFLSSATVCLFIAKNLPESLSIRVATNSIVIAEELRTREHVKVILVGGEMDARGNCYDGFAIEMLGRLRFDKAFITSSAISAEFGLSIQHSGAIQFWNAVIKGSRKVFGLYPTEKLGFESIVSICPVTELDCLITDWMANEETLAEFEEKGVHTIVVDEPEGDGEAE